MISSETKPCERAGCEKVIRRAIWTPSQYARRRFCSNRCSALQRYASGFKPPVLSHAQRVEMGRKGGLVAGDARRRQAARRVSEALTRFITDEMAEPLSPWMLARWKALIARAWTEGHTVGAARERLAYRLKDAAQGAL